LRRRAVRPWYVGAAGLGRSRSRQSAGRLSLGSECGRPLPATLQRLERSVRWWFGSSPSRCPHLEGRFKSRCARSTLATVDFADSRGPRHPSHAPPGGCGGSSTGLPMRRCASACGMPRSAFEEAATRRGAGESSPSSNPPAVRWCRRSPVSVRRLPYRAALSLWSAPRRCPRRSSLSARRAARWGLP
jgi:hypothetical protein